MRLWLRFVRICFQENLFYSDWLTDEIDKRKFLAAFEFSSYICTRFIYSTIVYHKLETILNEVIAVCFKTAFENFPKRNKKDHGKLQVCVTVHH